VKLLSKVSLNIYLASPYLTILRIGLSEDTGYQIAELWIIDLADFASVKSFADRFDKEGGRLDLLVENAGVLPAKTLELTSDGWESTSVRVYVRYSSFARLTALQVPDQ
jgi:NADP-dependent 3-hydroxy acid dehydrogenase YdfG